MFRKKNRLSSLEWEIMNNIWNMPLPVSVRSVLTEAYPEGQKAYTTVQTVMNNLVEKGFLTKEKVGLVNFYRPLKAHEQTLENALKDFANRTFGGSLNALANFLVDSDSLTPEEIASLKKLLDEKTRRKGDKE